MAYSSGKEVCVAGTPVAWYSWKNKLGSRTERDRGRSQVRMP